MGRIAGIIPSKSVTQRGLKYLRPIHKEIARMLVTGMRQCDIARKIRISQSRLSLIVNSLIFQNEMIKLEAERNKEISTIRILRK
jgi:hypothetical protein